MDIKLECISRISVGLEYRKRNDLVVIFFYFIPNVNRTKISVLVGDRITWINVDIVFMHPYLNYYQAGRC